VRFIQFAKWWRRQRDTAGKVLTLVISWLFISLATMPFIGVGGLALFLGGLLAGAILYLLGSMIMAGWEAWKEFSATHPTSQELLVRKLRGD